MNQAVYSTCTVLQDILAVIQVILSSWKPSLEVYDLASPPCVRLFYDV